MQVNHLSVPTLPALMALPFRLTPDAAHSSVLAAALNRVFLNQIRQGELDFLRQRNLSIRIEDAHVTFRLTLGAGGFTRAHHGQSDITITGNAYDFIELATGREDYDTLFFNRRLHVEGNTEVGLELKNFLDAQEALLPKAPKMVQRAGDQLMNLWKHWAN